jgi:hypothetical protein
MARIRAIFDAARTSAARSRSRTDLARNRSDRFRKQRSTKPVKPKFNPMQRLAVPVLFA